jgi:hypothetical protein
MRAIGQQRDQLYAAVWSFEEFAHVWDLMIISFFKMTWMMRERGLRASILANICAALTLSKVVDTAGFLKFVHYTTVCHLRHFATVFGLRPSSTVELCDRCIAARTACVVVELP